MIKMCINCKHYIVRDIEALRGNECIKKHKQIIYPHKPGCESWEGREKMSEEKNTFCDKIISGIKETVDRIIAEEQGKEKKNTVSEQIRAAIYGYRRDTGFEPEVIIANPAAWEALEKEMAEMAKMTKIPSPEYATFCGKRIYKAEDLCKKPRIRIARDVKVYDLEGGAE